MRQSHDNDRQLRQRLESAPGGGSETPVAPEQNAEALPRCRLGQRSVRQFPPAPQAATSFRSVTAAAKRSTSARLSRGKSEYSRTMSSYDMPSARHARMNDAERRVPRIVGFPPRRSGFVTRYRNPGIGVSSMSSLLGRPSSPLRSPIQTEVYVPRGPGPDVLRFPEYALHGRPLPLPLARLRHHPAQHSPHDRRVRGHPRHHGHPARWPLQRPHASLDSAISGDAPASFDVVP